MPEFPTIVDATVDGSNSIRLQISGPPITTGMNPEIEAFIPGVGWEKALEIDTIEGNDVVMAWVLEVEMANAWRLLVPEPAYLVGGLQVQIGSGVVNAL